MAIRWRFEDHGDSFTVQRQETTVTRHPNGFDVQRKTLTVTAETPPKQIRGK